MASLWMMEAAAARLANRFTARLAARLVRRFVRTVDGKPASTLRIVLDSSSGLLLRRLELDLSSIALPSSWTLERAFAEALRVVIPWTALASSPLELELQGVDIVLVAGVPPSDDAELPKDEPPLLQTKPEEAFISSAADVLASVASALNTANLKLSHLSVTLQSAHGSLRLLCASGSALNVTDEPSADWLRKSLTLGGVELHLERPPAASLLLLQVDSCSLDALLPLFSAADESDTPAAADGARISLELGQVSALADVGLLALILSLRARQQKDADSTSMDHYAACLAQLLADKLQLESRLEDSSRALRDLSLANEALRTALETQNRALVLLAEENLRALSRP